MEPMDLQATMNAAALEFAISVLQEKLAEYQDRPARTRQSPFDKTPAQNRDLPKKRVLSASARARIAQAQKRRWAEKHRQDALQTAKPETPAAEEEPGPAPRKGRRQSKKAKGAD